jgi:sulfonate transport system permease protein
MVKKIVRSLGGFSLYIILPVFLIVIWKGADLLGKIKPYTMPAPERVLKTTIDFIRDGTLPAHIAISALRVGEGFLIALALALALGISIGLSKKLEIITELIVQVIKPIPPIAWIPLSILWFGIGEASKLYIIIVGAFFPILLNTVDGIKNIDSRYFELSKVYEVQYSRVVARVVLPGALPFIMTGIRVGLANAWICVVAAEMIAATKGIGYMLMDGRSLARPDIVILGMLIIGIVGKIMDDGLKWVSKKIIRWT